MSLLKAPVAALIRLPAELVRILAFLLLLLLWLIIALIRWLMGKDRERPGHCPCPEKVPEHVRRRPDPCLYSQSYLQQQGLPVTWNNPDIEITETDGTPVSSSELQPSHNYIVHGFISNASFDPALGVSVRCVFRNWGISGSAFEPIETNPDGSEAVRFLNIGGFGRKAAKFAWRTPPAAGHYCIKVICAHPDDINSANNVGQENTRVVDAAPGETKMFAMQVFNPSRTRRRFLIRVDTYRIPDAEFELPLETRQIAIGASRVPAFGRNVLAGNERRLSAPKSVLQWASGRRSFLYPVWRYTGRSRLYAEQMKARTPLPDGWEVRVDGTPTREGLELDPLETRTVELTVTTAPGVQAGADVPVNVTAWDAEAGPIGGVTVVVRPAGGIR